MDQVPVKKDPKKSVTKPIIISPDNFFVDFNNENFLSK